MSERPAGIDPRGPRFVASITAVLLLVAVFLGLTGVSPHADSAAFGWFAYQPLSGTATPPLGVLLAGRALDPAFVLLVAIDLLFLWSVVSPATAPWGVLYRRVTRPRLGPPAELEDPRPPRFAQGVGLLVVGIGLVLHLAGVPFALPAAAAAAFVAAFLNGAFGLCLGCQLYLLLQRAGVVGRARTA